MVGCEDFTITLSEFAPINIVTEVDPLTAWKLMQEANLLIIAKSTFSFIPALLNTQAQVISPEGFLIRPDSWTYFSDKPIFQPGLAERIVFTSRGSGKE